MFFERGQERAPFAGNIEHVSLKVAELILAVDARERVGVLAQPAVDRVDGDDASAGDVEPAG